MEQADQDIEVEIYTDPLCCWSWAFQPQLEKLKKYLSIRATWQYKMGGLISSWNNFHDEVNSVTRPAQLGPVWMHAGVVANKPICHQLWVTDPPSSSYPACIAVKCAQLQSNDIGESFLQLLREACMSQGKNIARQSILFDLAAKLLNTHSQFDIARFQNDYHNDKGLDAFRSDLDLIRKYNINRFPTLIVKSVQQQAIIISGYNSYIEVLKAIKNIVPDIIVPTN